MKLANLALILILMTAFLVGCGAQSATSSEKVNTLAEGEEGVAYTSAVLSTSYDGALPVSSQLAFGTMQLEGTANAVTPEQARTLLPLWQAIASGGLQNDAETNAVLKQIEVAMGAEQMSAIAAMRLTLQDLGAWAEEEGIAMGFSPEAMATRQAEGGGQGPGAFGDMSEEERQALRATAQAGGFPGGPAAGMSAEEREAFRATAQASGELPGNAGQGRLFGGRAGGAARGALTLLAQPVVELLSQRATE